MGELLRNVSLLMVQQNVLRQLTRNARETSERGLGVTVRCLTPHDADVSLSRTVKRVRARCVTVRHAPSQQRAICEMPLEAIKYKRGSLQLLDQRLLPLETQFIDVPGCDEAFDAIKEMLVRGAPAIAIAAGLALAVELANKSSFPSGKEAAGAPPLRALASRRS